MIAFSSLLAAAASDSSLGKVFFELADKYQLQQLALPMLFTFVIIFGVLDMIKIFKQSINVLLAISITLFAMFAGPYGAMGQFLTNLYGTGAFVMLMVVLALMVLGALSLGGDKAGDNLFEKLFGRSAGMLIGLLIILAAIIVLLTGMYSSLGINIDPDTAAFLIIVLIIVAIFWAIIVRPMKMSLWEVMAKDFRRQPV